MYLLQVTDEFTETVHQIAFVLALLLSMIFYAAYKKYMIQMQNDDMIDHFLND